jgi:hypothetical protein
MDRLAAESVATDAAPLSLLHSAIYQPPMCGRRRRSRFRHARRRRVGGGGGAHAAPVTVAAFAGGHGAARRAWVALVAFIEQYAAGLGLGQLYLLTTDASGYFRVGYAVSRALPRRKRSRVEAVCSLCPDSAILMQKFGSVREWAAELYIGNKIIRPGRCARGC